MAKSFVLHDETVNTYGFRMLTSGADLTEFRKNPVMLLDHNDWQLPIGRWENIRIGDGKILADPVFDLKDERGKQVAGKVNDDFIRMASIGAWAPEEVSLDDKLKLPGQTGVTVVRWKVREASIVTIGANHNALAFYDESGKLVNLEDKQSIIRLFDKQINNNKIQKSMNILAGILNLADNATENEVATAVRAIIANSDRLKAENATLKDRIDSIEAEKKKAQKDEAIALTDAAIKDGRVNANAKEQYLSLFDANFDATKVALGSITPRQSVVGRITGASSTSSVALKDLQDKSWEELDKAGKLTELRDSYPEVYVEKFQQRFGCKPQGF
ncbi:hypothetical protein FACS1894162_3610 [Bacteroidia bacterium]|nr:hypothetical protein FACS1894162_3610 [Bacteroidia bacterium]